MEGEGSEFGGRTDPPIDLCLRLCRRGKLTARGLGLGRGIGLINDGGARRVNRGPDSAEVRKGYLSFALHENDQRLHKLCRLVIT
jgi:hypothetical protein